MSASPARARAIVLAAGLVAAALAVEGGLRAWFALRTNYDIEMWRYAARLKQPVDDARSHVHVPGRSVRLMGVAATTNSRGLRDVERPYEKPAGRFRIAALGDSFTFGWGVRQDRTYAKRLEALLNAGRTPDSGAPVVEVLNLGVGNYNTEQELEAFLREGVRYAPDAVVLGYYVNDAEPTQRHAFNLLTRGSIVFAFLAQRRAQLLALGDESRQWSAYYRGLYEGANWERQRAALERLAGEVRARGLPLIPVLLPDLRDLENYQFERAHALVAEVLAAGGAPALDLLPAFAAAGRRTGRPSRAWWVADDDPHPNEQAHEIIAAEIDRYIRQRGLIR